MCATKSKTVVTRRCTSRLAATPASTCRNTAPRTTSTATPPSRAARRACCAPATRAARSRTASKCRNSKKTCSRCATKCEAQINAVTLYDKKRAPFVKLRSEAPAFLLWRPYDSGASFLCIEPWYGLCDKQHFEGPFEQRPYVNKALPGKRWSGGFTIDYLR